MPGSLGLTAGRGPTVGAGARQARPWVHPPPPPSSSRTSLEATKPGPLSCRGHFSHFLTTDTNVGAQGDSGPSQPSC